MAIRFGKEWLDILHMFVTKSLILQELLKLIKNVTHYHLQTCSIKKPFIDLLLCLLLFSLLFGLLSRLCLFWSKGKQIISLKYIALPSTQYILHWRQKVMVYPFTSVCVQTLLLLSFHSHRRNAIPVALSSWNEDQFLSLHKFFCTTNFLKHVSIQTRKQWLSWDIQFSGNRVLTEAYFGWCSVLHERLESQFKQCLYLLNSGSELWLNLWDTPSSGFFVKQENHLKSKKLTD